MDFENPNPRRGVPHGGQVILSPSRLSRLIDRSKLISSKNISKLHSLLASGCAVADSLFPGIVDEWIENGARRSDVITEFRVMMEGKSFFRAKIILINPLQHRCHVDGRGTLEVRCWAARHQYVAALHRISSAKALAVRLQEC